jgi:23S rRNA pseudouridine2605 synthase
MTDATEARLLELVQTRAGVSRRRAEELVREGEVEAGEQVVTDPFLLVDPVVVVTLRVRGQPLSLLPPSLRIYRYHKPAGVLCSHDDPHAGETVGRVLRAGGFIGYTFAGRLDRESEGLVLLSNDGDLVLHLSHPRYEVEKVYRVTLGRVPPSPDLRRILDQMRQGIEDEGETLRIARGEVEERPPRAVVTLTEGKKREVRRLFARFGLEATRLVRLAIGPIPLGDLPPGGIERLSPDEEVRLRKAVGIAHPRS